MNPPPAGLRVGTDVFPYAEAGRGRPILFLHGAPGDHRMWRRHMELEVRTLIACGMKSRPVFRITSRAAARCIGGPWHFELPLAGHLWPEQDPEEFANHVGIWLARHRR